jgi:hypothetical protein
MKRRRHVLFFVVALFSLLTVAAGPTPPAPVYTIELMEGLPSEMHVGETYVVEVRVTSDIPFNSAMAMPDMFYPGRYVVAHGPDRSGKGTEATLFIPFTAKASTLGLPAMPDLGLTADRAPVSVAVGLRYKQGVVVSEWFAFDVKVMP